MGIPILGPVVNFFHNGAEKIGDFIEDAKDYGLAAAISDDVKEDRVNNAVSDEYDDKKWLVTAGSAIGGAVVGSKLGERFGAIGKIGGGIIFAIAAPKFINGVAEDVTGTIDYVNKCEREGQDVSFIKTLGSNIMNIKGQEYSGDSDVPDV